jgi:hypothetical protein
LVEVVVGRIDSIMGCAADENKYCGFWSAAGTVSREDREKYRRFRPR